jgi:hypothetical protein
MHSPLPNLLLCQSATRKARHCDAAVRSRQQAEMSVCKKGATSTGENPGQSHLDPFFQSLQKVGGD